VAGRAPPEGRGRWTLQLLADKLVELDIVDTISTEGVRTTLTKTRSNHGSKSPGGFPRQPTRKLSVPWRTCLEVYARPSAPQPPQVCLDETSTPRVAETRVPIPAASGQPERIDYEYARQGTANLCMVFEPLAGQRRVKVTERRQLSTSPR
jgi:hypothetical protein